MEQKTKQAAILPMVTATPLREVHEELKDPKGEYYVFSAAAFEKAKEELHRMGIYHKVGVAFDDAPMVPLHLDTEKDS